MSNRCCWKHFCGIQRATHNTAKLNSNFWSEEIKAGIFDMKASSVGGTVDGVTQHAGNLWLTCSMLLSQFAINWSFCLIADLILISSNWLDSFSANLPSSSWSSVLICLALISISFERRMNRTKNGSENNNRWRLWWLMDCCGFSARIILDHQWIFFLIHVSWEQNKQ